MRVLPTPGATSGEHMFALILPNGLMYAPKLASTLTRCTAQCAKWKTAEGAALACDKANAQRTDKEPKFELVVLYQEADVCAA
jgi:hypothetical protein